jgi:small-conductance mechanosensitive channel/ABC-type branched-subunit amino acid transport system substrate-binding protein
MKLLRRTPSVGRSKFKFAMLFLLSLVFVAQAVVNFGSLFKSAQPDVTSVRADGSKQDPMDAVLIVDTSGRNQFLGKEIAAGFESALRENKTQNDIRMIIRDSRGVPEAAAALADGSASGNRTLVIVGPTEAESVPALLESAKEGEVTALLPIGTPRKETHSKWSFSLQTPVVRQGQLLGKFLQRSVKGNRVGRFVSVNAPPDGLWAGVIDSYKGIGIDGLELITWETGLSRPDARKVIAQNMYFDAVIVSLPMAEAANVVRELRLLGFDGLIVVEGEASISNFANQFEREPKELLKPGYFTDGLISLSPFLPTMASEKSQRLIMDYRATQKQEPSWAYAYGYDTGQLIADFVRRARTSGTFNLSNPDLLRSNFRNYLAGLQSEADFVFGFTGQLKFGANNQRNQSPKLLVFKNKVQSPYFEQLADEPTLSFGSAGDANGISIGDEKYLLVPVVYTGVSVRSVDKIDFDTNSYGLTFDISFKSREPISISDIQFSNLIAEKKPPQLLEERTEGGTQFRRYRVTGTFVFNPTSADVILDRTTVAVSWRSKNRDANSLKFVIDPDYSEAAFQTADRKQGAMHEGGSETFIVASSRLGVDNEVIAEPGDPRSLGGVIKFSTATFQADLTRQVSSLTARFVNDLGLPQLKFVFLLVALAFAAVSTIQLYSGGSAASTILWWSGFFVTCFFSEVVLLTSSEQGGAVSQSLVVARYMFSLAFTLAATRVIDVLFTLQSVKRARSSDVQPVINFMIRFGLYFGAIGFFYTVVLGRELLPILATFSVLLTVFGLALREMIFDAIAGVAIAADGHLATGQWVNIRARDRNIFGVVQQLGWRYLVIRSRDEQVHFVPNSIVATQILSNLSLGDGFSRVEIPFVMSAGSDVPEILPMILNAVENALKGDAGVSQERVKRVIVEGLDDDRLRCMVQVYYRPSQSIDALKTAVLQAVQSVLLAQQAFSMPPLNVTGLQKHYSKA